MSSVDMGIHRQHSATPVGSQEIFLWAPRWMRKCNWKSYTDYLVSFENIEKSHLIGIYRIPPKDLPACTWNCKCLRPDYIEDSQLKEWLNSTAFLYSCMPPLVRFPKKNYGQRSNWKSISTNIHPFLIPDYRFRGKIFCAEFSRSLSS